MLGSREKVKPVAELAKARAKVLRCQADIRAALKVMDEADGDAAIPLSSYDAAGEVDEKDIFCGKCREFEVRATARLWPTSTAIEM